MSPTRAIKTTLWQYLMWVGWGWLEFEFEFDTYQTFTASPNQKSYPKNDLVRRVYPHLPFRYRRKIAGHLHGCGGH